MKNKSFRSFIPVFLGSFQARYLLVNASMMFLSVCSILGDCLQFYDYGRMGSILSYAILFLSFVNVMGSFVSLFAKAISLVQRNTKENITVSSEPPINLNGKTDLSSELKITQIPIVNPISLASTPGKNPYHHSQSKSSAAKKPSTPVVAGPKTPFSVRMSMGDNVSFVSPSKTTEKSFNNPKVVEEITDKSEQRANSCRQKKILEGEAALRYLGISYERLDWMTDNLRVWFNRQILAPLQKKIEACEEHFAKAGWSHLGPAHPAVYSLQISDNNRRSTWDKGFVLTSTPPALQVQTILELAQNFRGDQFVALRLLLEKYLEVGTTIAGHRSVTLARIKEMADDPWVRVSSQLDQILLMHFFCTFLEEKLIGGFDAASEAFSSLPNLGRRFFVALGESEGSFAAGLPKLQQIGPQLFRVLLPGDIALQLDPGMNHIFHTILLFLEFIRAQLDGFVGLVSLSSKQLQLIPVLTRANFGLE